MMSRTRTRLGCLSGAATFVTMSRSVTMPIGLPVSTTTRLPISRSRMRPAASFAVASAGIVTGDCVMISTTGTRARMMCRGEWEVGTDKGCEQNSHARSANRRSGNGRTEWRSENRADNVKARALLSRRMSYVDRDGELAVRIAREALEAYVLRRAKRTVEIPKAFETKSGAFVTLNEHPSGLLRGCIGYPQPFFSLVKSIEKRAEGAAEDPRFPHLTPEELDRVTVEVSILTPPELIDVKKPKDLTKSVALGVDGLSVAQGPYRGLLLPQVAVEYAWDAAEFLSEAGMKPGLLAHPEPDPATRGDNFHADGSSGTMPL